jgi:hypothetical protein
MDYLFTVITTPLAYLSALALANRCMLIVLPAIVGYAGFLFAMKNSSHRALSVLIVWAVVQSITVLLAADRKGVANISSLTWRAEEYKAAMFRWIETGVLPEGNAVSVLIFHLKQALLYSILALATANFLSLVLGCGLLNYMNVYVAEVIARSRTKLKASWIAWNPWSVIRVVAFLCLGVALSTPLLAYVKVIEASFPQTILWLGISGVCLDIILKIALSREWSRRLKAFLPTSGF